MSDPIPNPPDCESREFTTECSSPQGTPSIPFAAPVTLPPAPRRPRVWTVFLLCVVALIGAGLLGAFVLVAVAVVQTGPTAFGKAPEKTIIETLGTALGLLSTMASTMVLLAMAALSAAWLSPVPWRERLRLRPPEISAITWATGLFGMLALNIAFTSAMSLGLASKETILYALGDAIASLSGFGMIAGFLIICVAPGIAEELLFRGYVQTRFAERWQPGWAILWSALLFAIYHMDLTQGVFAFAMGLFLGLVTERARSIVPAMVCHAVVNAFSFSMTAGHVEITGWGASLVAVIAGAIVMVACFEYVRRRPRRPTFILS